MIVYAADWPSNVYNVKLLFMNHVVQQQNISSGTTTTRYVLHPVGFSVSTQANNDVIITTPVTKATWHTIVLAAFPNANLNPSGSGMKYTVGVGYGSDFS